MTPLHPDVLVIDDISRSAVALAELIDTHESSTPVPTCGDWTLADLVWHLTEVQLFWGHIIGNRPHGPETYERPVRATDNALSGQLRTASQHLVELLTVADPEDHAWSWSDDHTVGFTIRRQVHEALVHGIDGILAVRAPMSDVPSRLAADGIDEMVRVMLTGTPDWAVFQATGEVVELRASDTNDRWVLRSGQIIGIEPTSGSALTLNGYELSDDVVPTTTIEAEALDLLLFMWGRRDTPTMSESRQIEAAATLRRVIVAATS